MSNTICIYHGGCPDGFGAAYAVWLAIRDCRFHAGTYGVAPPDVTGKDVVMVDFSYKRPVLLEMAEKAKSILILDHHKTAEAELVDLPENVAARFDMSKSGAILAWEHYHSVPAPPLLEHIQDRDLWRFELPGTREIGMALSSYPQDFDVWHDLTDQTDRLAEEGAAITRYFNARVEELSKNVTRATIGGFDVPIVNAPWFMASELAGKLAEGEPFAACWYEAPHGRVYSLRSRGEEGVDVSEVAAIFGGGGHRNAAGFRLPSGG